MSDLERALALDPNYVTASGWLITNRVERGDLIDAYRDVKALVDRHPDSAASHFTLAYVLRYRGAIGESAQECNSAYARDSGDFGFRSCAFTFQELGNYSRAIDFLKLGAGSNWSNTNFVRNYLRQGKTAEARSLLQQIGSDWGRGLTTCPDSSSPGNVPNGIRQAVPTVACRSAPGGPIQVAPDMIVCHQPDLALTLLQSAVVTGHYCAYDGMKNDVAFAPLRNTLEYAELLSAAKQCQSDFLTQRSQPR